MIICSTVLGQGSEDPNQELSEPVQDKGQGQEEEWDPGGRRSNSCEEEQEVEREGADLSRDSVHAQVHGCNPMCEQVKGQVLDWNAI